MQATQFLTTQIDSKHCDPASGHFNTTAACERTGISSSVHLVPYALYRLACPVPHHGWRASTGGHPEVKGQSSCTLGAIWTWHLDLGWTQSMNRGLINADQLRWT